MSGNQHLTEPTRRRLTQRQADTVRRLTDAAVEEVRQVGYENLSVRDVARRAEVGAATAYTYFASKDHMLAEVFWRRLRALPPVPTDEPSAKVRVIAVLTELALLVSGEPELAEGCTAAMFGTDPDVRQLRITIGMEIRRRIDEAAGPGNPLAGLLELAYFGAMVQAGLGYSTYGRVADRLAEAVELIMR
jgi:AcrR family transcriptional regulator